MSDIYNIIRNSILSGLRDNGRYFNSPPIGGYHVDEEYNYVLTDVDDLSSILLLDIVTQFGSPGSNSAFSERRKKQIKSINYKKVKQDLLEIQCPICIENFNLGEYQKTLCCKHVFHKKCIDRWFKKDHSDCPMCRAVVIN